MKWTLQFLVRIILVGVLIDTGCIHATLQYLNGPPFSHYGNRGFYPVDQGTTYRFEAGYYQDEGRPYQGGPYQNPRFYAQPQMNPYNRNFPPPEQPAPENTGYHQNFPPSQSYDYPPPPPPPPYQSAQPLEYLPSAPSFQYSQPLEYPPSSPPYQPPQQPQNPPSAPPSYLPPTGHQSQPDQVPYPPQESQQNLPPPPPPPPPPSASSPESQPVQGSTFSKPPQNPQSPDSTIMSSLKMNIEPSQENINILRTVLRVPGCEPTGLPQENKDPLPTLIIQRDEAPVVHYVPGKSQGFLDDDYTDNFSEEKTRAEEPPLLNYPYQYFEPVRVFPVNENNHIYSSPVQPAFEAIIPGLRAPITLLPSRFPPRIEQLIEKIQTYFSTYNAPELLSKPVKTDCNNASAPSGSDSNPATSPEPDMVQQPDAAPATEAVSQMNMTDQTAASSANEGEGAPASTSDQMTEVNTTDRVYDMTEFPAIVNLSSEVNQETSNDTESGSKSVQVDESSTDAVQMNETNPVTSETTSGTQQEDNVTLTEMTPTETSASVQTSDETMGLKMMQTTTDFATESTQQSFQASTNEIPHHEMMNI